MADKRTFKLYECEHGGDLDEYVYDISRSGGLVVESHLNVEAEVATVVVDLKYGVTWKDFHDAIKKTDTHWFMT